MRRWDELIAEFRALGGTFDNARLGEGRFGRGLFAIDPSRPVRIRVPENLLPRANDVVFENGRLTLSPDAEIGARERKFFDDYHAEFSWGGGGRAEIERKVELAQALPAELRETLVKVYRCGSWFEPLNQTTVEQRFLASRRIGYGDHNVMMPVLELANHGVGPRFASGDGIGIQGSVTDEIFVNYRDSDSYGLFVSWGFASPQPQALSIALNGNVGQQRLYIDRDVELAKRPDQLSVPPLAFEDGVAKLKFLVTGNRSFPRVARGIFYKVMREAGLSGYEEAFDMVQYVNQTHFLGLLEAIEPFEGPMIDTLRRMARYQLQSMSFSFGVGAV